MVTKYKKRLQALTTLVKRESNELVSERADLARALALLKRHETAMHDAGERVNATEAAIRSSLKQGDAVELDALQALRGYQHECHSILVQARAVHARSDAAARQLEQTVARRRAGIRAVERVSLRIGGQLTRESERQTGLEIEETWLQRRGLDR